MIVNDDQLRKETTGPPGQGGRRKQEKRTINQVQEDRKYGHQQEKNLMLRLMNWRYIHQAGTEIQISEKRLKRR